MKLNRFFLSLAVASLLSSVSVAETLRIQFQSIEGKGCQPMDDSFDASALYLDYIESSGADSCIGCKSIEGTENLATHSLDVEVSELPLAASGKRMFLRFYALHSEYRANHYEADLNITQELAQNLTAGKIVRKSLRTSVVQGDRMAKASCTLNILFEKSK